MHTTAVPTRHAHPPRATPPAPPRAPAHGERPTARLEPIDLVRGLVIALMVLDHVREYWSDTALLFQPTDLTRTTPALFATRWITHLCAPTFVFLAGASVFLQWSRAADRRAVARFQLTRGAWLALLDLTVVSFALNFAAPFPIFEVVWAIGMGLVLLTPLLRVRPAVVALLGAMLLVGAHVAAPVAFGLAARAEPATAFLLRLLFVPGPATPTSSAARWIR